MATTNEVEMFCRITERKGIELDISGLNLEWLEFVQKLREIGVMEYVFTVKRDPFPFDRSIEKMLIQKNEEFEYLRVVISNSDLLISGPNDRWEMFLKSIENVLVSGNAGVHIQFDQYDGVFSPEIECSVCLSVYDG